MKMTIESFYAKQKQQEEKRKEICDSIAELSKREAALVEECKAAVASGDVDTYIKKNREKEDISAALFVKRSFLDKMGNAVSEADAREAWESYVAGYNKEMQKALDDYAKARANLLNMYKGLAEKQAAALKVRDHLNESVCLANPERSFPMVYIPCLSGADTPGLVNKATLNVQDPDLIYYYATREKEAGMMFALNQGTPAAKDSFSVVNIVAKHRAE